jgi:hypothetical protein
MGTTPMGREETEISVPSQSSPVFLSEPEAWDYMADCWSRNFGKWSGQTGYNSGTVMSPIKMHNKGLISGDTMMALDRKIREAKGVGFKNQPHNQAGDVKRSEWCRKQAARCRRV